MKKDMTEKIRTIRISNNVLFVLAIILIGINSYTFMIASKEQVTGKALEQVGTTRICIGTTPYLSDLTPYFYIVVNGTYNTSVNGTGTDYVDFFYYYFGIGEQFFARDNDTDADGVYNATLNTTELPDGNCNYRIIARAYEVCGIAAAIGSATFTVNNNDTEPVWDEFNNSLSTNFSNYTSWTSIPGARIGIPGYGTIDFTTFNFDAANLNNMFNISYNNISFDLDTTTYACFFDQIYLIKFFNVTQFAEPVVLRNGELCDLYCFNLNYSEGNYSFYTRVPGDYWYTIAEGGNLSANFTFTFPNKTYDNSPTVNITTYIHGSVRDVPITAECYYKTDYDPSTFTLMNITGTINHSQRLPEQNWSYIPTNMGHYPEIQHHDYYSGEHLLTVNCTALYDGVPDYTKTAMVNTTFYITYTDRDRVYYADGDEVKMYLELEEPNLNISVDLSQIDSNFDPANVTVTNNSLEYNISYNISSANTRSDGQYNVTIEAINETGHETMNGSIFMHLKNDWYESDIDDAFDCWTWRPGYYFDEVGCDWDADVVRAFKRVLDPLYIEVDCFDGLDNEGDCVTDTNGDCPGDTNLDGFVCGPGDVGVCTCNQSATPTCDENVDFMDKDCLGLFYSIRRDAEIASAFMADPCINNICFMCLGTDNNGDGTCDYPDGVNVQYLNSVRPGAPLRVKFNRSSIVGESVRTSVNFLHQSFNLTNDTSFIEQLPRKELGYNATGGYYLSVTGTTFGPGLPDSFTGALNERITIIFSNASIPGHYPYMKAGRSIGGSTWQQDMIFFWVNNSAIVYEGDKAEYCFDRYDNDLNDPVDCLDPSCNLTYNPANSSERCEYGTELTCDDGYDNDWDGYTDCEDNDCFKKNGTNGPCYATEDFNTTSCADSINNDFDWGYYWSSTLGGRGSGSCDNTTSISYEDRIEDGNLSTIRLTDCKDYDCNGQIGNINLSTECEYCHEVTCDDDFDNDADMYYDCEGNAYRDDYERDCDRWHDLLITCPTTELNCSDEIDNDLDSDSLNGGYSWLGIPVFGGWDCQDLDCLDQVGDEATGALCEYRNETICDDGFDNDRDGYTDCEDPTQCQGLSGADYNLTGLCRPCAEIENISIDACRDTDDNDYDGDIDCDDINCSGLPGPGVGLCGLTENNCTDGIDNDYDWLIDFDDSECDTVTYMPNEKGPGQCSDGIDNDNDGNTDCSDSDCTSTLRCQVGAVSYGTCTYIRDIGVPTYETEFVRAGQNFSVCFRKSSITSSSLVFAIGNTAYSLKNITPVINTTTTFMTGNTSRFVLLRGSNGLLASSFGGIYNGPLDFNMVATTAANLTPGTYYNYIATTVYGIVTSSVEPVYIAENNPPTVHDINATAGHRTVSPGAVNVTFIANATDNATYDSGIAFCQMELPGVFLVNASSCSYTTNLTSGTYNVTAIAYDGAWNPSAPFSKELTLDVWTVPIQKGEFYNPYPAENYPDKNFFNNTESLNIGVNFEDGSGFTDNDTGCIVNIRNSTHIVHTDYVNLSVVSGEAHCNGQVDLEPLMNLTNRTNISGFPSAVYYFDVTVHDDAARSGTSSMQDFNFCYYYYDNQSSKYRCRDQCQEMGILNRPPVLISNIPNQTWPRGTKLAVIDLDDYFMDPDYQPLTFTWVIDNPRINVSIDRTNMVTFNPDISFYGFAHITFYAHDPFTSTPSNEVTLEVLFTPLPQQQVVPPSGGGGGGKNMTYQIELCEEDWACTDWGPCTPSGYQFRNCRDRNECGTTNKMPNTTRPCIYIPTCRDKLKNQGEEGVDCGGPCPPCPGCKDSILNQQEEKTSQIMSADPKDVSDCGGPFCPACPTCEDNTWNQGEEGVDCGGPCRPCATCDDGIRNQGEANIDCGGPCQACNIRVVERAFNWNLILLIASSLLLLLLLLLALLFGAFKKKFLRLKAKLLNYYMRSVRMFEKKKMVEKELPILQWVNTHIASIEEGISSKSVEDSVNAVDRLVRIFFKRIFLIRYAFTNEELVKELEKHKVPAVLKKAIEILFEELSQIKYGGESVDKEDIKTMISQVNVITERLVSEIESKNKTKISITEHDIDKISETLSGAQKMGVKEAMKKIKK